MCVAELPASTQARHFFAAASCPDAANQMVGCDPRVRPSSPRPIREQKLVKAEVRASCRDSADRHACDLNRNRAGDRRGGFILPTRIASTSS